MAGFETGDSMTKLEVTPDKYVPHRYAGASGDFNPIHIDPEFAKMVGLPGSILHGLYVMGLVAKAATLDVAAGDPGSLRRLSVQFRGMSYPEQTISVTGEVTGNDGEQATLDLVATQGDTQVIRNASAEIALPPS